MCVGMFMTPFTPYSSKQCYNMFMANPVNDKSVNLLLLFFSLLCCKGSVCNRYCSVNASGAFWHCTMPWSMVKESLFYIFNCLLCKTCWRCWGGVVSHRQFESAFP